MDDQSQLTSRRNPSFSALAAIDIHDVTDLDSETDMDMGMGIDLSESTARRHSVLEIASIADNAASIFSRKPTPTLTARRAAQSPAFKEKLEQMALPLAPLVQLTTGTIHPSYPDTLLGYWLLSESELDSLAHFYHQRSPSRWTLHYPCPVTWRPDLTLDEKRRKIGKFIGLKGCDTPVCDLSEDELMEEARRARHAEDADVALRRKLHW